MPVGPPLVKDHATHMTYPHEFFAKAVNLVERPGTCFIIMPFARIFTPVHRVIVRALESAEAGFQCRRADEFFGGHQVMEDILREIGSSELILADVTGRNPNVFYELGIAHMLKNASRVLLVTQRVDDIPFDLRAYRHIVYTRNRRGLEKLSGELIKAARGVSSALARFNLSEDAVHDTGPAFAGTDRCLYSIRASHVILGGNFAKCRLCVYQHVVNRPATLVLDDTFGFKVRETRSLVEGLPFWLRLDFVGQSAASFAIVPRSDDAA